VSHLQLSLRVGGLEASIVFYQKLLGVAPAKQRADYVIFVVEEPGFKLVLLPGERG